MIIDLNQLKEHKKNTFQAEIVFSAPKYTFKRPLLDIVQCLVDAEVQKYANNFLIKLKIDAKVVLESSYTLKPFKETIQLIDDIFLDADKSEQEDEYLKIQCEKIELDDYIYSLIIASLPMRPVKKGEELPSGGENYRVMTEDEYHNERRESGHNNAFASLLDIDDSDLE